MWEKLGIAFALFLVLEGVLPFLSPKSWRQMMLDIANKSDHFIRYFGFFSMLLGLMLLFVLN